MTEKDLTTVHHIFKWFVKNCKIEVKETIMLKQLRIKAGLGHPPEPFHTIDVESQIE